MGWREIMAGPAAVKAERDAAERLGLDSNDPTAADDLRTVAGQQLQWGLRASRPRPAGKANRLAVTALICAAAIPFLLVAGLLGAVFGFVALDEIEESEGKERGKAIALWAIGLGFLNIALSVAIIALVIAAVV